MKLVEVILRYYLLAIMLIPCADGEALVRHDDADVLVASQEDGHQHSSGEDDCSPLCVCHCCHIHFTIAQDVDIKFVQSYRSVHSTLDNDLHSNYIFDFLKPPRREFS
ncbi:DUF6660 family protein [Echinicola sediminis]